ncbi:DUF4440 domain-containing protein [Pseudomonas purpurea]|uniref:nuclear transport factor 2 family protein n=1 Tax=Pseudomonas purpurea TaxID=3136737 RepID=UPI003262FF04
MDLHHHLLYLEARLQEPATRADAQALSQLIADDFLEFGASGNAWSKTDVVQRLPDEPFTERTISDFSARLLSESVALVTYRSRRAAAIGQSEQVSLRSSVWRKQKEQWQMVFHQGTPQS